MPLSELWGKSAWRAACLLGNYRFPGEQTATLKREERSLRARDQEVSTHSLNGAKQRGRVPNNLRVTPTKHVPLIVDDLRKIYIRCRQARSGSKDTQVADRSKSGRYLLNP